jgi:hypothetical protein
MSTKTTKPANLVTSRERCPKEKANEIGKLSEVPAVEEEAAQGNVPISWKDSHSFSFIS